MKPDWAEENLQTIRTLMERSAVYRRALAPIMIFAGLLGVASAALGLLCHLDSMRAFDALWLGTAAVVVAGAFLIARRQAIKDQEQFWSPPTRRVGQALLPPLFAGMFWLVSFVGNNQHHIDFHLAVFLRLCASFGRIFYASWHEMVRLAFHRRRFCSNVFIGSDCTANG